MKSKNHLYIFASISIASLLSFKLIDEANDLTKFLVKYKSEWSKPCTQCQDYTKSYRAYFRNTYTSKLDVKVAAQEQDKRWRTFVRLNMTPNDTIVAYACKGNGKYLCWVREAGDLSVVFPSDDVINKQHAE